MYWKSKKVKVLTSCNIWICNIQVMKLQHENEPCADQGAVYMEGGRSFIIYILRNTHQKAMS